MEEGNNWRAMLRAKRKERFRTIAPFAEEVGVTQSYISQLESGSKFPNWGTWTRLCKQLGLDPNLWSEIQTEKEELRLKREQAKLRIQQAWFPAPGLTEREAELIKKFRLLSPEKQELIERLIKSLQ